MGNPNTIIYLHFETVAKPLLAKKHDALKKFNTQ